MITFVLSMHALSFSLKRRFALEMSMLVILIRVRKPELHRKFFFSFSCRLILLLIFRRKISCFLWRRGANDERNRKLFHFFKKISLLSFIVYPPVVEVQHLRPLENTVIWLKKRRQQTSLFQLKWSLPWCKEGKLVCKYLLTLNIISNSIAMFLFLRRI